MASLFEMTDEILRVQKELEEMDLDEQSIEDTLEGMALEIKQKAKNVAFFIKNMEKDVAGMKELEKNIEKRRKSFETKIEQMEGYLLANMVSLQLDKLSYPEFDIKVKENRASVVIEDESQIPQNLFSKPEPPEPKPDKNKIRELIEAGIEIPGAKVERKKSLSIK